MTLVSHVADELAAHGYAVVRGVVATANTAAWLAVADLALAEASNPQSPHRADFVPTATSLRLAATELLPAVHQALCPLWPVLQASLGGDFVVSQREAWIRRQFAPQRGPQGHAPHSWHQDGALRYDFIQQPVPHEPPLPLLTAWLPLVACGETAPGLELVARCLTTLCSLAELRDEAIRDRFAAGHFVAPVLAAGDVLLLSGGTLHRTHVAAGMERTRTSLELRYFRAPPPARVGGEFLACA